MALNIPGIHPLLVPVKIVVCFTMKPIASSAMGLTLLLVVAGIPAKAQNQTPSGSETTASGQSLGSYARQVRKTPETGNKPKVFDNDNLPKSEHLSIVGKPQAPASEQPQAEAKTENAPAATAQTGNEAKPATTEKTPASNAPEDEASKQTAWKQWGDKIRSQQQQIDLLSRELDVLQREYQIRAAAMYADAGNRLRNQADWDKQDTQYKQQIADKQKAVDEAKQKLEELQENARKAGAPTSVQEQ
jgi:hypothetical protein